MLIDLGRKGRRIRPIGNPSAGASPALLADFGGRLAAWREAGASLSLPALFDRIAGDIGYQEYIDDGSEEGSDRWGNVEELRRLAFEYQEQRPDRLPGKPGPGLRPGHPARERSDSPTLLTLHAAKGLEFGQVFIIGLDEGLLPHSRSLDDPEEMAEERRLFYVGLTRAKNNLYLVRAEQRSTFGSFENSESSRFLDDIPAALIRHMGGNYKERRAASSSWEQPARWEGTRLAPFFSVNQFQKDQLKGAFDLICACATRSGVKVWCLSSAIRDGEEEVDVQFKTVGIKHLLASLAKLELI